MVESSDESSDDNETEPLAARIARPSRTTKAKVKYTLSDDDDNDDNNDDNNDGGKLSGEDDWMEIRSSESEDEMAVVKKMQKQQPKKSVKFATKDQEKMDTEATSAIKDSVNMDEPTDEAKIPDDNADELVIVSEPAKKPVDSKPPAEKPKKKATTKKQQPKQDKGTTKQDKDTTKQDKGTTKQGKGSKKTKTTTQTTLFDTGVKVKVGAKRKAAADTDQEPSSSLPKKPAKQPPKVRIM